MTAERYTVVFTGYFTGKEPGEYLYLPMSGYPGESGLLRRGRPPYGRMRNEIAFEDLPENCRRQVLDVYRELWDLESEEIGAELRS